MTEPSTPAPAPRPRPRRGGAVLGLVAGVLLVGVGAWLASRPAVIRSLTFVPYTDTTFTPPPLSGETFVPPRPWTQPLGLVAVGIGLLVIGFVAGWVAARRRGGQAPPSDPPR